MSSRTRAPWFPVCFRCSGWIHWCLTGFLCDNPSKVCGGARGTGRGALVGGSSVLPRCGQLCHTCDSPVCLRPTQPPNATGIGMANLSKSHKEGTWRGWSHFPHPFIGNSVLKILTKGKFWMKIRMSQINKMLWVLGLCPSPFSCFQNTVSTRMDCLQILAVMTLFSDLLLYYFRSSPYKKH